MFLFDKIDELEARGLPSSIEKRYWCWKDPDDPRPWERGGGGSPGPPCPDDEEDGDDDDDGGFIVDDAAARTASFQDQCFLIDFQKLLLERIPVEQRKWHDLIAFDASANMLNKLTKAASTEKFFNFHPHQLSSLVPKIRLFKVKYKGGDPYAGLAGTADTDIWGSQDRMVVIPKEDLKEESVEEFIFDDHITKDIITTILQTGQGRAYGIGLKSFEYEFDGKDPATTEKAVKARLELVFTNFEALTKAPRDGAPPFLDLLLRTKRMIPEYDYRKHSTGSDNILNFCRQPSEKKEAEVNRGQLVFNPKYRRIKASVGWAVPPTSGNQIFKQSERDLIENLHLDIFLEMINYEMDFKNNGTIHLTIEYRASIEGELTEPTSDIFYGLKEDIRMAKGYTASGKEEAKKIRNKKIDDIETGKVQNGNCSIEQSKKLAQKEYREAIKRIDKDHNQRVDIFKLEFYRMFLTQLLNREKIYRLSLSRNTQLLFRGSPGAAVEPGKIEKPNKEYADARDKKDLSKKGAAARSALIRAVKDDIDKTTSLLSGTSSGSGLKYEDPSPEAGDGGPTWVYPVDCELMRLAKEQKGKEIQRDNPDYKPPEGAPPHECQEGTIGGPAGDRLIHFMFLGDILDLAMFYVNQLNPTRAGLYKETAALGGTVVGTNVRLCTSMIEYTTFAVEANMTAGTIRERINIADIPISLEHFVHFWKDKVIKPGRTTYLVKNFIKDVMTELFFRTLGDACYGNRGTPVPALSTTTFTASRKKPPWDNAALAGGSNSTVNNVVDPTTVTEPIPRTTVATAGTRGSKSSTSLAYGGRGDEAATNALENWLTSKQWKYPRIGPNLKVYVGAEHLLSRFFYNRPADGAKAEEVIHYHIIHGAQRNFMDRTVNKVQDEKDGIYHLAIGLDRGIVKEIKFESSKLKYATEARTIHDGDESLGQLFNKFNATVDLFGCPIFRNGQYIFLDPQSMGVKSTTARLLGLGGYYNIYNVMGELTPSGYVTRLKCMYNSSGVCSGKEGDTTGIEYALADPVDANAENIQIAETTPSPNGGLVPDTAGTA